MIDTADAQSTKSTPARVPAIRPGTNTSFAPLKQIDAGVLNIGYAEAGPANGPPVILLHGWPYDIYSFVDVAPLLASAGYRVIVPYLRGYGTTRFLSNDTFRNGQQAAVALDIIALMDALKIQKAVIAGFRLGRADGQHHRGAVAGALQGDGFRERLPDRQPRGEQDAVAASRRVRLVVPVLLCDGTRARGLRAIPPRFQQTHLAAGLAEVGLRRRHVRSQRGVVRQSGSCRDRDPQLSLAARPSARRVQVRRHSKGGLRKHPSSACRRSPTEGDANGAPHPDPAAYAKKFSGKYEFRLISGGVGHNLPQEAPQAFAQAVIDVDGF